MSVSTLIIETLQPPSDISRRDTHDCIVTRIVGGISAEQLHADHSFLQLIELTR